jgi:RNA polymerase sigma factor (sigma-70 family)
LGLLYSRHWTELCGYVKRKLGARAPDAQDIVQQTFLRFASLASSEDVQNARAYLYRTAHNLFVEEHRRLAVGRAAAADMVCRQGLSVEEVTPEREVIAAQRMQIMRAVLSRQPAPRRRSFLMSRIDELSAAEIARRTGYSESMIKKHIMLVMIDLEDALEGLDRAGSHQFGDADAGELVTD